jgi:hypothetical protein
VFGEKVQSEDGPGSSAGKETLTLPVDGAVDFGGSILTGRKAAAIGRRLVGGAGSLNQTELGHQLKRSQLSALTQTQLLRWLPTRPSTAALSRLVIRSSLFTSWSAKSKLEGRETEEEEVQVLRVGSTLRAKVKTE